MGSEADTNKGIFIIFNSLQKAIKTLNVLLVRGMVGEELIKEQNVITYEMLYDLLRREKSSNELQQLDQHFFRDVVVYLRDKKSLLADASGSVFSFEEQRRTQQQVENAQRIIRDIYEWREKKIMLLARDSSRSQGLVVNKAVMLAQEQALFSELLDLLSKYRSTVLLQLLSAQFDEEGQPKGLKNEALPSSLVNKSSTVKVRVIGPVSEFMGPSLQTLGPYTVGELVDLPEIVASILVNRKQAERLE